MKYRRHDSVSSSASKFPGDEVSRSSYMLRTLGTRSLGYVDLLGGSVSRSFLFLKGDAVFIILKSKQVHSLLY